MKSAFSRENKSGVDLKLEKARELKIKLQIKVRSLDEEISQAEAFVEQQTSSQKQKVDDLQVELGKKRRNWRALQNKRDLPDFDSPQKKTSVQSATSSYSSGSEGKAAREVYVVDNLVGKPEKDEKKLLAAVQQSTCLSVLNNTFLKKMVSLLQFRFINNGERLLRRGERPTAFYILIAGDCEMIYIDESESRGTPVERWTLFGENDLYFDTPRLMSCKCVQRGAVWFLSREKFTKLMPRHYLPKKIYGNLKSWFPGLTKDDLKFITRNSKFQRFESGMEIVKTGSLSSHMYLIVAGEVFQTRFVEGMQTFARSFSRLEAFGEVNESSVNTSSFTAAGSLATTCIEIPIHIFAGFKEFFVEPVKTLTIKEEDGLTFTTKSSGYESLPESTLPSECERPSSSNYKGPMHIININNSSNIAIGDNSTVYINTAFTKSIMLMGVLMVSENGRSVSTFWQQPWHELTLVENFVRAWIITSPLKKQLRVKEKQATKLLEMHREETNLCKNLCRPQTINRPDTDQTTYE